MTIPLEKKRNELMLTGLIVSVLIGIGWIGSCGSKPTLQVAEKQPQRAEGQPGETPVSFQPTKQNKGSRCAPRYYAQVGSDDDNNPVCYELQKRLVDAAKDGNLEAMRAALGEGASPEGSIYNYHPPLHTAAARGQSDAVRLLLDNGAQVNRVSDFENTALNMAASDGHEDVVRVLLERGADACYKSSAGTAGDIARARGYKDIAELLKAAEATKCK
jgi:ankyrin repeat protein